MGKLLHCVQYKYVALRSKLFGLQMIWNAFQVSFHKNAKILRDNFLPILKY